MKGSAFRLLVVGCAAVATASCGTGDGDHAVADYAVEDTGGSGGSTGEARYLSVHGRRSVPADGAYQCSSEFTACLAMDGEGRTRSVESLCPSSYEPEGTWRFEYRLWKDAHCTEPLSGFTCEQHEGEWLGSGPHTNKVRCWEDEPADKDFDVDYVPPWASVFLILDEDAIDNGGPYVNWDGSHLYFSSRDVNDDVSGEFQRMPLRFFDQHADSGKPITLFSGEVGDEGWFALKKVPYRWHDNWKVGLSQFLWEPWSLYDALDEVPFVTPLRARGLASLKGRTVCALVYDSDVSVNYDPLYGDLSGDTLGLAAFDVLDVEKAYDHFSGALPRVQIRIRYPYETCKGELMLFKDAPEPWSSSEPYDVDPWSTHDDDGYGYETR